MLPSSPLAEVITEGAWRALALLGISIEESPGGIALGDLRTALQLCPCTQEMILSRCKRPRGWQLSASGEQGGWLHGRAGVSQGTAGCSMRTEPEDGRLVGEHLAGRNAQCESVWKKGNRWKTSVRSSFSKF